jgi:hypothetical protein
MAYGYAAPRGYPGYKELTQRMSRGAPQPKQLKNGADYHVDVAAHLGMIL